MKILVEYESRAYLFGNGKRAIISETRDVDDDCYPRVIGKVLRELHDNGFECINIRCLDPHPKDLTGCLSNP